MLLDFFCSILFCRFYLSCLPPYSVFSCLFYPINPAYPIPLSPYPIPLSYPTYPPKLPILPILHILLIPQNTNPSYPPPFSTATITIIATATTVIVSIQALYKLDITDYRNEKFLESLRNGSMAGPWGKKFGEMIG